MINIERIIAEFQELVAIDAPTFGEREIADVLRKKLEVIGFQVKEDEAGELLGGNCGNLYGYLEGNLPGKPLLFSAHMDTVTPAFGKKAVVHPDGKITSAGDTVLGADDVAGLVSIMEAMRSIREDGIPHRSIEVLFPIAEEVHLKGSTEYDFSNIKSSEAYVLDLTGEVGKAAYMAPTILTFKAVIKGKAAHAGFAPEEGIHSIAIAAHAIAKMELGRIDELTTFNIGSITSGKATNIIPDLCMMEGEIRSLQHDKAIGHLEKIKELFEHETKNFGAILEWEEKTNCFAYETDINGLTANRYREACEKIGIVPEFVKTFGGSDLNIFTHHGILGLVLTNAMNKVHSCEEYTQVDELVRSTEIVRELMLSEI